MQNNLNVTKEDLQKYSVRELKQFLIDHDIPIPNSYTGKSKTFFVSKAISVLEKSSTPELDESTSFASPRPVSSPRVPMTRTRSSMSINAASSSSEESSSSEGELTISSPEKRTKKELLQVLRSIENPPTGLSSMNKAGLVKMIYDLGLVDGQPGDNEQDGNIIEDQIKKIVKTTPKKAKLVANDPFKEEKKKPLKRFNSEAVRKQLFKEEPIVKPEVLITSPRKRKDRKLVDSLNTLDNQDLFDRSEMSPSPKHSKPRPDSPLPKLKQLTPLKLTPRPKRAKKAEPVELESSFGLGGIDSSVKKQVKKMRSKSTDTSLSSSLDTSFSFNKQFDYIEPSYFQSPKKVVQKIDENEEEKSVKNSYKICFYLLILTVLFFGLTSIIYYNLTFKTFCKNGEFNNCTTCPINGQCSKYFLTCNKGFKNRNGECVENNEVVETALKLAEGIARTVRKKAGKNCVNNSPVVLSDDSLLNISVQAPEIFSKALELIRNNPSKYNVSVSDTDNFTFSTEYPILTFDCYSNEFFKFVYRKMCHYAKTLLKELLSIKYIEENKNAFAVLVVLFISLVLINWYVNRKLTKTQMFHKVVKLIWNKLLKVNKERSDRGYRIPLEYLRDEIYPNGEEVVWKEAVKEVLRDSRVVLTCEVIEGEQMDCLRLGEDVYAEDDYSNMESYNDSRNLDILMSPRKIRRR